MEYTREHIKFIIDNYIKNEDLCVPETGHTLASIKLMIQNIVATYGFLDFSKGNPLYTEVADQLEKDNPVFGEPMIKRSFRVRF